ncbi:MAG: hypothetical protein JRN12_06155 [Nitrososphaerota archaeon]|nr:hypothetical protein [Nitrososphaerota archaeon]
MLSISDSVGYLITIAGTLWGTLAIFGTELIEKRMTQNIEEAEKKRKVGKNRLKALRWPTESLRWASRLWGAATLLFAMEIIIEVSAVSVSFETYGLFFWLGLIVSAFAGIQTYRVFEFMMNRNYHPSFRLVEYVFIVNFGALDVTWAYVFYSALPFFNYDLLLGQLAVLAMPVSILASMPFMWALHKRKEGWEFIVSTLGVMSPYFILVANRVLLYFGVLLR